MISSRAIYTITASAALLALLFAALFPLLEAGRLTAQSADDSVTVSLEVTGAISINEHVDVALQPGIDFTSDTSTGGATWTIETNDSAGYTLTVHAGNTPALAAQDGQTDIGDMGAVPAEWSVSEDVLFGFRPYGTDAIDGTFGDGSGCDTGDAGNIPTTVDHLYRGFDGATPIDVATRSSTTPEGGIDTTVCFAVEQDGEFAESGSYEALVTATATVN